MEPDENAVTPRPELSRSAFELGFRTWSSYSQRASQGVKQDALESLRVVDHAFPCHPALPSDLNLQKSSDCWTASGISFWDSAAGSTSSDSSLSSCGPGLPEIEPQKHTFPVTKSKPTKVTLSNSSESGILSLLGDKDDHVTILILAWAYILSVRWTELIPGANNVQYTDARADSSKIGPSNITVPIEAMSREAARWWQAVLAPGQGWLATVDTDGGRLYSPWSFTLSSKTALITLFLGHSPTPAAAPDSATALDYLSEYVVTYGVEDQSRAALSTILCLPFVTRSSSRVTLPAPSVTTRLPRSQQGEALSPLSPLSLAQVDKLMALSCNTRGVEALLLSCFFDPSVPCNLVSPFLQGTFAALDKISHDPPLLLHTLFRRSPRVGFLWVGAAVLRAHTSLLERARYGSFEIDLLSAVWTGTIQTFMQLPVSATAQPGRIRRGDECRLAYLASKDYQQNIPHTPWKPFGTVELKDSELDVQIHAGCRGHGLRYRGWAWDCWEDGRAISVYTPQPPALNEALDQQPVSAPPCSNVEVPYDMLDLEHDFASGTATLNIFMWLRRTGFAASEQHIRRHEWLCEVFDEEEEEAYEFWPEHDDDSACAVKKRPKSAALSPKLGGWLVSTQARREGSV